MVAAFIDNPRGTLEDLARKGAGNSALAKSIVNAAFNGGTRDAPNTATRTSHAFTLHAILAGQAVVIGGVFGFVEDQTCAVDEEYEINRRGHGLPVDIVPQNVTGRSIRIERYDLYTSVIESVFQREPDELLTLADQYRALTLREVWRDPTQVLSSTSRAYQYVNCRMTQRGRTVRADDNRIVRTSATIVYQNRIRVL